MSFDPNNPPTFKFFNDTKTASDRARAEIAADEAELSATEAETSAEEASESAAEAAQQVVDNETVIDETLSAASQALASAGVDPDFISYEVGVLPSSTSATEGTIGAYYTSENVFQRIEWDGDDWVEIGEAIATKQYVDNKETFDKIIINGSKQGEALSVNGGLRLKSVERRPTISFTCDDSRIDIYNWFKPLMESRGIPASMSVITDRIGTAGYFSAAQLLEVQALGWSVGSETKTHGDLEVMPESQVIEELRDSRIALENIGIDPKYFIYPGGKQTEFVRFQARNYYRCAFRTITSLGVGDAPNTYLIPRYSADNLASEVWTVQTYKDAIDATIANNEWLVLAIHPQFAGWSSQEKKDELAEIIDYAIAQGVDFKNVEDGMDMFGSVIDLGDSSSASGEFFRVGSNGRILSNRLGSIGFVNRNNWTGQKPLTDYRQNYLTYEELNSAQATADGMPGPGVLITHRVNDDAWSWQIFQHYRSKNIEYRYWDGSAWTAFQDYGDSNVETFRNTWGDIPAGDNRIRILINGSSTRFFASGEIEFVGGWTSSNTPANHYQIKFDWTGGCSATEVINATKSIRTSVNIADAITFGFVDGDLEIIIPFTNAQIINSYSLVVKKQSGMNTCVIESAVIEPVP
jgi:peptidoglycan/xylan/chitin deacetylase (PgdA/CDA1 family)